MLVGALALVLSRHIHRIWGQAGREKACPAQGYGDGSEDSRVYPEALLELGWLGREELRGQGSSTLKLGA